MATVYEIITDRIISLLERGTIPWIQPWSSEAPKNLTSGKPYRGINVFMLSCQGFSNPWWLTFKQARERRGSVKRGQKGTPVIFWSKVERETEEGQQEGRFVLRYYTVFNVEQCEGIPAPATLTSNAFSPIEECERIVSGFRGPTIHQHGAQAYYRPSTDEVNVAAPSSFATSETYYSTLFHELGHSTGHGSRLARKGITDASMFGSHEYSREELVAEMCASFLCAQGRIERATIENSASYIASWLKRLRDDRKLVVEAAGQAQKAADLILGRPAYNETEIAEKAA